MIKFRSEHSVSTRVFLEVWSLVAIEAAGAYFLLISAEFLGFLSGLLAFSVSFLLINFIASRILALGDVRRGVGSSLIAVICKFLLPLLIIWYAIARGFSLWFVFVGLVVALANVSFLLYRLSLVDAKSD